MIKEELLKNRIVFLNGEIDNDLAIDIITKLLYLDSINNDDISLYINSSGGSVIDGLAIIDCMNTIKSNVATYCIGSAYSMASVILSCGKIGKRYMLENSEVMIHAPSGTLSGKSDDVSISARRLANFKKKLIIILAKNTKKTIKQIDTYFKYDKFMDSDESLKFGLVDKIIKSS